MRVVRLGVLLVVAAGVFVACDREKVTPLTVTATDYAFSGMPASITGGAVEITFRNDGQADHELALLPIGDTSAETLSKDVAQFEEGGAFPSYLRTGLVPFELEPGKSLTSTVTIPPGEYTLACVLTDAPGEGEAEVEAHALLGMYQRVNVAGESGELGTAAGRFAARDYTFDIPENLSAGEKTYTFVNQSPTQWHHIDVQDFGEGVNVEQATSAFQTLLTLEEGALPPAGLPLPAEESVAHSGIFGPGGGQTFSANFQPGHTYLAVCFIHDITGGAPHAIAHNMLKAFTVPA